MTLPTRATRLHNGKELMAISAAYADGVLLTREEWLASIDYEAAASELPYSLQMWQVKAAVDAAIGEEEQ